SLANVEIIKLNNVVNYPQDHYHEVILEDLLPFVRCGAGN
ncbi:MAG: hydrolase, partial [Dolichospermum sp.]